MTDPLYDLLEEARRQCLEARELTDCPTLRPRLTAISALLEQAHIPPRIQTARRRRPHTKRAALIDWLKHPDGASAEAIENRFQWSSGALSAVLTDIRQEGYVIERNRLPGQKRSTYRILRD
ncbi:DUF3489 domain-containing protein [Maricaulis alexandrii]|uniref:DUF3489 domain-containing protein n=1 Tax=Maricaulis alexandrii TaxID=2570354 RepID=UPI0011088004|nr:DUF3489 domain-containing protein [Maricaulis alexandrii]